MLVLGTVSTGATINIATTLATALTILSFVGAVAFRLRHSLREFVESAMRDYYTRTTQPRFDAIDRAIERLEHTEQLNEPKKRRRIRQ